MNKRNLLTTPCWDSEDLGQALPDSPHAVSVALPKWKDVIAYEEKNPECINSLRTIYPRFGLNPLVSEIAEIALKISEIEADSAWPYPNQSTAEKANEYCLRVNKNASTRILDIAGLKCLVTDKQTTASAKAFWQHTGLGASSREAAIALNREKTPSREDARKARSILKIRLAEIYQCPEVLIELLPSGMAALTTAIEIINEIHPKRPTLQLGFPYVDVLKLPQVIFNGGHLLLSKDLEKLAIELDEKQPSAVIVELPSNPMLECIDLPAISQLAHKRGIAVIADDTIGSAVNIDPLPYADLVFSSLTKSFAGRGDILAGSMIISPNSQWKQQLSNAVKNISLAQLSDADAIELADASKDAQSRIKQLNKTCLALKRRLEQHPAIARVLHPESCPNFQKIMREEGGYGCLLSFELIDGLERTKRFYDDLKVCKGPSLGTSFTLVCPYVLLAHYKELDWAKECGAPPHILRVSVGLEDPEELWERFKTALISSSKSSKR